MKEYILDIDLSQIYIVKPEAMVRPMPRENNNHPNFVMGSSSMSSAAASQSSIVENVGSAMSIVVGASLLSIPASLLLGAISGGGYLAAKIIKEKSSLQTSIDENGKKEIQQFLFNHGVTVAMVKEFGFVFPPGHPKVDMLYKRHPLADVSGAKKDNVYIPYDKYDDILLAERESELLKLLVHLGATKITITHNHAGEDSSDIQGGIAGGSTAVGNAEVSGGASSARKTSSLDKRVFSLAGKKWKDGDTLDRQRFSWVDFEPSWEALIVAREIGGCTKAALDITENTSFSSEKGFSAKVEYAVYSGQASAEIKTKKSNEKVYFIEAEFCEMRSNG